MTFNNLQWLICHKTKPNHTKKCKNFAGESVSFVFVFLNFMTNQCVNYSLKSLLKFPDENFSLPRKL